MTINKKLKIKSKGRKKGKSKELSQQKKKERRQVVVWKVELTDVNVQLTNEKNVKMTCFRHGKNDNRLATIFMSKREEEQKKFVKTIETRCQSNNQTKE